MRFSLALPFVIGFFGMFVLSRFTPIESRGLRVAILTVIVLFVLFILDWRRRKKENI